MLVTQASGLSLFFLGPRPLGGPAPDPSLGDPAGGIYSCRVCSGPTGQPLC